MERVLKFVVAKADINFEWSLLHTVPRVVSCHDQLSLMAASLSLYLDVSGVVDIVGVFFFYSGIAAVGIAFAVVYIPETTNKSLEEVVQEFHFASQSGKLALIRRRKRKAQS